MNVPFIFFGLIHFVQKPRSTCKIKRKWLLPEILIKIIAGKHALFFLSLRLNLSGKSCAVQRLISFKRNYLEVKKEICFTHPIGEIVPPPNTNKREPPWCFAEIYKIFKICKNRAPI